MAKSISRYLADATSTTGALDGLLSIAAQTNITSLGTLSSLTVSGSAAMTLTTAAQTNITSVGTLTSLAVSGTSTFGGGSTLTNTGVLTLEAGGNLTTASGNDLNIVYPDGRSLFIKEASTTHVTVDNAGKVGIGNTAPLGKLTISSAAGANAPTSVTAANTYLQLGSDDFGASNNGKFMIGFGYTDATNTNSPAYIGFEETSTSGDTKGNLTFYTRDVITDTAPTERLRITDGGIVLIGGVTNTAGGYQFKVGGSDNQGELGLYSNATAADLLSYDRTNSHYNTLNIHASSVVLTQGEMVTPNGATEGYHIKQTGGTATPRITNDANNWTIIRPGASGADVAINNYANSANLFTITDEGNVGLNENTPTSYYSKTLQINGSGNTSAIKMTNTSTGNENGRGMDIAMDVVDFRLVNREVGHTQIYTTASIGSPQLAIDVTEDQEVCMPKQPSFLARADANSGLNAHASAYTVRYGAHSVLHNIGSHFDSSNYKFVAPVAGVYFFSANLRVDGFAGAYSYLTLKHYSSTNVLQSDKGRDLQDGNNSTYMNHIITSVVNLAAGDYVFLLYIASGDTSVNIDADSWFSGYLIG